jgi:hypothetical protein
MSTNAPFQHSAQSTVGDGVNEPSELQGTLFRLHATNKATYKEESQSAKWTALRLYRILDLDLTLTIDLGYWCVSL